MHVHACRKASLGELAMPDKHACMHAWMALSLTPIAISSPSLIHGEKVKRRDSEKSWKKGRRMVIELAPGISDGHGTGSFIYGGAAHAIYNLMCSRKLGRIPWKEYARIIKYDHLIAKQQRVGLIRFSSRLCTTQSNTDTKARRKCLVRQASCYLSARYWRPEKGYVHRKAIPVGNYLIE